jgi:hypothetical protein
MAHGDRPTQLPGQIAPAFAPGLDFLYTKVTAFASGNNIEFRFSRDQARSFKDRLTGRYGSTQELGRSNRRWHAFSR